MQFVEHVFEGANRRHFFCKIVNCPHMRPFPSKVRMERHLLKCHGVRVEIPDVRKASKKMKNAKMPGHVNDLLKHEATIAFSEFTSVTNLPMASKESFMAGYMFQANESKRVGTSREGMGPMCSFLFKIVYFLSSSN